MKIKIYVDTQQLHLLDDQNQLIAQYTISTAAKGLGEVPGSYCTPRGKHIIRAKIGANYPENTVFVARRPTGELYTPSLAAQYPNRDWILTRILWLSGCEVGLNRLGTNDTMRRYIYIHGTPDTDKLGTPSSHGCIRMENQDLIALFDQVPAGTEVEIIETMKS